MPQAHYARCSRVIGWDRGFAVPCATTAIVRLTRPAAFGPITVLLCHGHLDHYLDTADARHGKAYEWTFPEPSRLEWVYDAGVRFCSAHLWPAELCSDWTHNRRTLEGLGPWRSAIGPST